MGFSCLSSTERLHRYCKKVSNDGGRPGPSQRVLNSFALLVDGVARAAFLPQGPLLVQLFTINPGNGTNFQTLRWGQIAFSLSLVMSVRLMSANAGTFLGRQYAASTSGCGTIPFLARLGGIALLLFYLATSQNINNLKWLLVTCSLASLLAGFMTGVTSKSSASIQHTRTRGETLEGESSKAMGNSDAISSAPKIHILGCSLSIVLQYLWLPDTSTGATGNVEGPRLSLFAIAGVVILLEVLLRLILVFCSAADFRLERSQTPNDMRSRLGSFTKTTGVWNNSSENVQVTFSGSTRAPPGQLTILRNTSDFSLRGRSESVNYTSSARSRVESNMSMDEFFDCHSVFSDVEDIALVDDEEAAFSGCPVGRMVAVYSNRRCVFEDGSSAFVPPGESPCRVPSTYLKFHAGYEDRAHAAWEATQRWRLEKRVWRIHTLPNPWFAKIKRAYPHFVHGHSKAGFPIIYEQPGQMDLKRLFMEGCQVEDMLYCYTFFMEYVSNVICTKDEVRAKLGPNPPPHCSTTWGIMVVMDVKGAGLSHLSGNVARYVKSAGDINSAHYPMSMKRAFVINAPFWLGGAWSGIKGILPDSVQVDILSERMYPTALREYIDEDQIPPEYGGTSSFSLGQHPYEVELRQLVDQVANAESADDAVEPTVAMLSSDFLTVPALSGSSDCISVSENTVRVAIANSVDGAIQPLRRRVHSVDHERQPQSPIKSWKGHRDESNVDVRRFAGATLLLCCYSSLQGAMELALPLWILSPTSLGGLGYEAQQSCVVFFCSMFVLLCATRKVPLGGALFSLPMKSFRVSTGLGSAILAALAFVTVKVPQAERTDSVQLAATTIVMLTCLAAASGTGRIAVSNLHSRSGLDVAERASELSVPTWVQTQLQSGRVTALFATLSEVTGILCGVPLLCRCFSSLPPLYVSSALLVLSWLLLLLYAITFSPLSRSMALHHDGSSSSLKNRRFQCCDLLPVLGEAVVVSTGDVASLMEEGHWCSTPILHPPRSTRVRSFSDASVFSDPTTVHRHDKEGSFNTSHKAK